MFSYLAGGGGATRFAMNYSTKKPKKKNLPEEKVLGDRGFKCKMVNSLHLTKITYSSTMTLLYCSLWSWLVSLIYWSVREERAIKY